MLDDSSPPAQRADAPDAQLSGQSALAQLRAFIADRGLQPGQRLPPERVLCVELGLKRSDLRQALGVLEQENRLWRHVGKGTFLTDQEPDDAAGPFDQLARKVSPADVMRARAALEPAIARDAALHASASAIGRLQLTTDRTRQAATWREYEALDNEFHRQIAEASGSTTLLALFDQLNTLRRMVSWGHVVREGPRPPAEHGSFAEHDRVVDAIAQRSPDAAQNAMRTHLRSVEDRLLR